MISIHALREEGDSLKPNHKSAGQYFYPRPPRGGRRWSMRALRQVRRFLSTPSARRATIEWAKNLGIYKISIHALREEGDTETLRKQREVMDISIHALREEGDLHRHKTGGQNHISIHALREEGDGVAICTGYRPFGFLSTPSARRATFLWRYKNDDFRNFYPRPPRGGRLFFV